MPSVERMQLAGVPCEGNLHYWVNADGSYQEEGMNKVKGKIWDKVCMHVYMQLLACLSYQSYASSIP